MGKIKRKYFPDPMIGPTESDSYPSESLETFHAIKTVIVKLDLPIKYIWPHPVQIKLSAYDNIPNEQLQKLADLTRLIVISMNGNTYIYLQDPKDQNTNTLVDSIEKLNQEGYESSTIFRPLG